MKNTINNDQKLNLIALNKNPYNAQNLDTSAAQRVLQQWYGGSLDGIDYNEKPLMLLNGWTQISYLGVHYQAPELKMEAGYPDGLAVEDFENRFRLRTPKQKDSTLTLDYFSPKNYFSDDDPIHCRKHGDSTHFFYPGQWLLECGPLLMSGHGERNMWEVPAISDRVVSPTFIKALSERYECDVVESESEYILQLPAAELAMSKDSKSIGDGKTRFKNENHKNRDTLVSLLKDISVKTVYCENPLPHEDYSAYRTVYNGSRTYTSSEKHITPDSLDLPSSWTTLTIDFTGFGLSNLNNILKYTDRLAKLGENK